MLIDSTLRDAYAAMLDPGEFNVVNLFIILLDAAVVVIIVRTFKAIRSS
ncbi:MAG: hypothetical protein K0Q79_3506 [Flavipsychrobacter sp.]|jgi:hypothetical protein|nr:hypothetical protein [Flavipsychrobacter sp.]